MNVSQLRAALAECADDATVVVNYEMFAYTPLADVDVTAAPEKFRGDDYPAGTVVLIASDE